MPDELPEAAPDEVQPDIRHGAVTANFRITDSRGKNKKPHEPVPAPVNLDQPTAPVQQVQSGSVARIRDYLLQWVQRAFAGASMGERVGWDISMIIAQANGQQAPMWLIYAEIDGIAIGQRIPGAIMAPVTSNYEDFQKGCGDLLENLRQQRTQLVQQANGQINGVDIVGPPK
jgi:hypothetical protein